MYTIDGIEIPLVYSDEEAEDEIIGDESRMVDGTMRSDLVALRQSWRLQTRPITGAQKDAILDYLRLHSYNEVLFHHDSWADGWYVLASVRVAVSRLLEPVGTWALSVTVLGAGPIAYGGGGGGGGGGGAGGAESYGPVGPVPGPSEIGNMLPVETTYNFTPASVAALIADTQAFHKNFPWLPATYMTIDATRDGYAGPSTKCFTTEITAPFVNPALLIIDAGLVDPGPATGMGVQLVVGHTYTVQCMMRVKFFVEQPWDNTTYGYIGVLTAQYGDETGIYSSYFLGDGVELGTCPANTPPESQPVWDWHQVSTTFTVPSGQDYLGYAEFNFAEVVDVDQIMLSLGATPATWIPGTGTRGYVSP